MKSCHFPWGFLPPGPQVVMGLSVPGRSARFPISIACRTPKAQESFEAQQSWGTWAYPNSWSRVSLSNLALTGVSGASARVEKVDTSGIEPDPSRKSTTVLSERDNQLHHVPLEQWLRLTMSWVGEACNTTVRRFLSSPPVLKSNVLYKIQLSGLRY